MSFSIFNVVIDHVSEMQLETLLRGWISGHDQKMIVTPNAEIILAARQDKEFLKILNSADLALPDTVSLRFAVAAQGAILKYRHPGSDTVERLAKICSETGERLMLFGATEGSAEQARKKLRTDYPGLDVVSVFPGWIEQNESGQFFDQKFVEMISQYQPKVIAVALGQKKQEQFILEHLAHLPSVRIAIGVGGAFEMLAGVLPRAPKWMRKIGLEWLWRFFLEPKRYRRMYKAFILFPVTVAYDTLKRGQFFFAIKNVVPEIVRQLIGK
ncbi:MAG: WecB/TagA/CpsF family glycosyltransferase [Patescibacteria group bacterium]